MKTIHGAECAYKGKAKLGTIMNTKGAVDMAKKSVKKLVKKSTKKSY